MHDQGLVLSWSLGERELTDAHCFLPKTHSNPISASCRDERARIMRKTKAFEWLPAGWCMAVLARGWAGKSVWAPGWPHTLLSLCRGPCSWPASLEDMRG